MCSKVKDVMEQAADGCNEDVHEGVCADFFEIASFGPSLDEFEVDTSRDGERNQLSIKHVVLAGAELSTVFDKAYAFA